MTIPGKYRIIFVMLIWGSTSIMIRFIDLPGYSLQFIISLFAGVFLFAYLILSGRIEEIRKVMKNDLLILLPVMIASAINSVSYFESIRQTSIAMAVTLHYIAPVVVAFAAPVIIKERAGKRTLIALIISLAGMAVMFYPSIMTSPLNGYAGIFYGIISGLAYGFFIIYNRRASAFIRPEILFLFVLAGHVVILIPFVAVLGLVFNASKMGYLAVFGIVHIIFCTIIYFSAFKDTASHDIGLLGYLELVFAVLYAFIFLKEIPSVNEIIGSAAIIAAGIIVL